MGWQSDEFGIEHEGVAQAVLADGTRPNPVRVPVAYGKGFSENTAWWLYNGQGGRPLATAVRAECACGWASAGTFPVDFRDHEKTEGWADTTGPTAAWNGHIEELLGTAVPEDVVEVVNALRTQLRELAASRPLAALSVLGSLAPYTEATTIAAAVTARTSGRAWSEIGNALGTTRQAAFQRFARHMPPGVVADQPSPSNRKNRDEAPVFEVEQSLDDSDGWDPDDPSGYVESYERSAGGLD